MEVESGGEHVTFQEQPITGDGPDQESAIGCVADGKKEFSLRKCQQRTFQNPLSIQ